MPAAHAAASTTAPNAIAGGPIDWPRYVPFLRWRSRITRGTLRDDLIAGLTGALVVLPQARGVVEATWPPVMP